MSTELWKVGIWIVTTGGIAGLITLAVLFPAVMGVVFQGFMKLFGFVLNYRIGCALVAAVLAGLAVDYVRHSHDDAVYAARVEAFNAAQVARDAKIEADTRELVTKELADAAPVNTAIDKDVKELKDALPPVVPETGNPFRVGPDACRLRRLAGEAGCGPVSPKAVPKAKSTAKRPFGWRRVGLPGAGSAGPRPAPQSQ